MGTRAGRFEVTFSLPSPVFDTFVAFKVEDIEDIAHARQIERALLDGGCESVYVSRAVKDKNQPFISEGSCTLPPGAVGAAAQAMKASWRHGR